MSGSKPGKFNPIDQLVEQKDRGPSAVSAAALELLLEEEKAQRKIERFFWVLPMTILGSGILIKMVDSIPYTLFIIIISIVLLIGFASWLEVPWILIYLEKAFARFSHTQPAADQREEN
jgi:hypothetical protein